MATRIISSDEQSFARATKQAIQAAGGLEVCARETGLSTSQLSRCSSPNYADSITERDAAIIDSLTHGHAGHPFILRARARLLGCLVIDLPDATDDDNQLLDNVTELTVSLGDTARSIHDALHPDGEEGPKVSPAEAITALARVEEHERSTAKLRKKLERLAGAKTVERATVVRAA